MIQNTPGTSSVCPELLKTGKQILSKGKVGVLSIMFQSTSSGVCKLGGLVGGVPTARKSFKTVTEE